MVVVPGLGVTLQIDDLEGLCPDCTSPLLKDTEQFVRKYTGFVMGPLFGSHHVDAHCHIGTVPIQQNRRAAVAFECRKSMAHYSRLVVVRG